MRALNRNVTLTLVIVAAFTGTSLTGCKSESSNSAHGSVTPQLLKISTGSGAARTAMSARAAAMLVPLSGSALQVNSDIDIAQLKAPITEIYLANGSSSSDIIYTCSGATIDDCMVDLANATALTNLLASAGAKSVHAGTYDRVRIGSCKSGASGYYAKIKASGTYMPDLSGSTYYTQAGAATLTTDSSAWDETKVYFNGCSREYLLPTPVTVTDGGSVSVKLYFDIADIAFFGNPASSAEQTASYAGGSSFGNVYPSPPTGPYVAVGYVDVAGTIDSGTPSVERYRVTVTATMDVTKGTVGLYYTSAGAYFGGYTRSYWDTSTSAGSNHMVTPVKTFASNNDGVSYTLTNIGSSADSVGMAFNFFQRADHTGQVADSYYGTTPLSYTATKLP